MPSKRLSPSVIHIAGAREHNLKNVHLDIPRGQLVVITGVSGSGKSTLAFDIVFSEGQRRFLDCMSAYARQYVQQLAKPEVDEITGVPPTVSIEQRTTRGGGKSTVGTVTEIYQFLRLLFARIGVQYCPQCKIAVEPETPDQIAARLEKLVTAEKSIRVLAPVIVNRKGFHTQVGERARKQGFHELRVDGQLVSSEDKLRLDRFKEHDIEFVIGILDKKSKQQALRLTERALELGQGTLMALTKKDTIQTFSTERTCPSCRQSFAPLDPKLFSYNSSRGWCPTCRGFGETFYLPDVNRGADADSIENSWFEWQDGDREICPTCDGSRINSTARSVRLPLIDTNPTIETISNLAVSEALTLFKKAKFKNHHHIITRDLIPEIVERLHFLEKVGLDYLQLHRSAPSLSGGESQRIRLAAQLGSNLSGVLYVLDEPTIGLHAEDNVQLIKTLIDLKDRGNSLLVVEHDDTTMMKADHIIDLGPQAGVKGGEVIATGDFQTLKRHPESPTGKAFKERIQFPRHGERRRIGKKHPVITVKKADKNNLKSINVEFPLSRLVVVTGISGSGKSTLVHECLAPEANKFVRSKGNDRTKNEPDSVRFDGIYEVDQTPIGKTPRSTPATYVGFFDRIRQLFAQTPEARMRGYQPGRFSFNSAQGRCPECKGTGLIKLEMSFMPAAHVRCETCEGTRYTAEILDIEYLGKNIAQVLDLSVVEAIDFFQNHHSILRPLQALSATGLDYLRLGQTSPTLSGGEAQRVKLVSHLLSGINKSPEATRVTSAKHNLFILEEPTIGLHRSDVFRLVDVLQKLVDAGHSVVVIEHNLDLIAESDWILDLGPGGGSRGGRLVAAGSPEMIADKAQSITGKHLKPLLKTRATSSPKSDLVAKRNHQAGSRGKRRNQNPQSTPL